MHGNPLLDQIRSRIADDAPNDHPHEWLPVQPPTSLAMIATAEASLGFALPALLRQLYTEIGNGGFGPVFGLLPLSSQSLGSQPPPEAEYNLVSEYTNLTHLGDSGGTQLWPHGLVPVFYCGCTVFEFVDCQDLAGPVVWLDVGSESIAEIIDHKPTAIPSLDRRLQMWLDNIAPW